MENRVLKRNFQEDPYEAAYAVSIMDGDCKAIFFGELIEHFAALLARRNGVSPIHGVLDSYFLSDKADRLVRCLRDLYEEVDKHDN